MMNSKNVVLATLMELLRQWENTHNDLLSAAQSRSMKISDTELKQLEAVLLNLQRLRGLIMWIEQGERIKQ